MRILYRKMRKTLKNNNLLSKRGDWEIFFFKFSLLITQFKKYHTKYHWQSLIYHSLENGAYNLL